jgi:hypothetical protein
VNQHIQTVEALEQAGADAVDRLALGQIERQKRRRPAGGADRVVGLLQPALGARMW